MQSYRYVCPCNANASEYRLDSNYIYLYESYNTGFGTFHYGMKLNFDLSSLPSGLKTENISSATLYMFRHAHLDNGWTWRDTTVYSPSVAWTESNYGDFIIPPGVPTVSWDPGQSGNDWKSINVKSLLVHALDNYSSFNGFAIHPDSVIGGYYWQDNYYTRASYSYAPYLVIEVVDFNIFQLDFTEKKYGFSSRYDEPEGTTYQWEFGDGGSSTDEYALHTFTDCSDYLVTMTRTISGVDSEISRVVELSREVEPDFVLRNNYGPAPLTFRATDITNYTCTGFTPTQYTWRIIHYGCYLKTYGHGADRTFTISAPGQYGLIMCISDGHNTYCVRKDYCIIVTDPKEDQTTLTQIEFSNDTDSETMRHNIRTKHNHSNSSYGDISFNMWSIEDELTDVGDVEIMRIKTDRTYMKNVTPFVYDMFDIGAETNRFLETNSKYFVITTRTQSKILELWSGE